MTAGHVSGYERIWARPTDIHLTGKGCVIGIIDQPSWLGNPLFSENIASLFQVAGASCARENDKWAPMHGAAVVSIAVGEIGVAREASVVYAAIRTSLGRRTLLANHEHALEAFQAYANAGNRLDVLSTSHGWRDWEAGAKQNRDLVEWFEARNIPVFSTNEPMIYPCGPLGLAADWRKLPTPPERYHRQIAIPVDERLIACRNRQEIDRCGSLFYRIQSGGISWAVPFLAGLFALAREASPRITRHQFQDLLLRTGRTQNFAYPRNLLVPDMTSFANALGPARGDVRNRKQLPILKLP